MIRPMASNVSTLSGIVANGHQAIHFVSSAPSKIPYGGFSPVRLQTGCQPRPSLPLQLIRDHSGDLVRERLFRSRTCLRRHSRLLTPPTRPVALGSASGYAVRQPHRLLWPHPSFCLAPPALCFYGRRPFRGAEGPHFYLPELEDVPPSLLRWLQGVAHESKPLAWPSPIEQGLGNHIVHTPVYVWCIDEAATFT
jgi:hypothetical protein